MEYFMFRLLVAGSFFYIFIEFMIWINDYDDIPKHKSSRDIHINTTKDKSPGNHGGY